MAWCIPKNYQGKLDSLCTMFTDWIRWSRLTQRFCSINIPHKSPGWHWQHPGMWPHVIKHAGSCTTGVRGFTETPCEKVPECSLIWHLLCGTWHRNHHDVTNSLYNNDTAPRQQGNWHRKFCDQQHWTRTRQNVNAAAAKYWPLPNRQRKHTTHNLTMQYLLNTWLNCRHLTIAPFLS